MVKSRLYYPIEGATVILYLIDDQKKNQTKENPQEKTGRSIARRDSKKYFNVL